MTEGTDDGSDQYGYRRVAVDDVTNTPNPTRVKRELDEELGVSLFGFNYYEADPGEQVPWGYHRHPDHEELFFVVDGTLEVETPNRAYRVESQEAFFIPAGAPNRAVAAGNSPCRFLAVGAPKESDAAVISERCPECGEEADRTYRTEDVGTGDSPDVEEYVLECAVCGADVGRFSG